MNEVAELAEVGRRARLAVLGAAVVGAAALPIWRVGIGWTIVGIASFAGALFGRGALFGGGPSKQITETGWRAAAALGALVLFGFAGVRAAPWLVAICVTSALLLGSYAVAGGRAGLVRGFTAVPLASVTGLRRLATGIGTGWVRALGGMLVGIALLVPFGALFAAADPTFAKLLDDWAGAVPAAEVVRGVIGFAVAAALSAGAAHVASGTATETAAGSGEHGAAAGSGGHADQPTFRLVDWLLPLVMLDALFGTFVWVQFTTLFAGEEVVLTPGGPDYADYARQGFLYLAVVTVLALAVTSVLAIRTGRQSRRERVLLRVFGGLLCALTLVVVASALKRMALYVGAYGFTGERLLGNAFEAWLGLVFVLVMVAGVRLRTTWLSRAVVAAAVVVLIGVTAVNPEALMARTHIDRLERSYPVDVPFVSSLSADAVAELDRLPEPDRTLVLCRLARDLARDDPWYAWNPSRQQARRLLDARGSWRQSAAQATLCRQDR